jgi:hypothetical protein
LGVLVAGIICFVSDGFFHERVVTSDWRAIYAGLRASEVAHSAYGLFYFALFELGRALIALWVYALMRSMCKPGWQTAAVAGVIMWLAFSVTGPAQFIPLGFYSPALWIKVAAFQLVTSIIATIAGAAIYKEA